MLKIKDYLALRRIRDYLDNKRNEELRESNGYTNKLIEQLCEMIGDLDAIIFKLEED